MRFATILLTFLPLIGCTAAEQCRLDASRELRSLDRMIATSETEIAQGYRLVETDAPFTIGLTLCIDPSRTSRLCIADDRGPYRSRERINIPAEQARLASLRAQRSALAPKVQAALAACPAD